jgi:CBS domain-containing protein
MGDHNVGSVSSQDLRSSFINHLLNDVDALDYMLENNLFESGITRIGAEQEFCLVSENWRPSNISEQILKEINDPHFTTELARYNLEINLDPFELTTDCFSKVEHQLKSLLDKAEAIARKHGNKIILTGILPTISKHELTLNYMTGNPRYAELNRMMRELRGNDFELHLKGVDELSVKHDSVLFEACNTSFQIHLQIDPSDFNASYNWSQAISGPVLGVSTNSPLLLGRELWSETRIALFQQSIDTRNSSYNLRDQQPRVTFGDSWGTGSISDLFKNDIAQFKILLAKEIESDSMQELKEGKIPKLKALSLHNSTIYRWNRPCYGVGGGKPHLRIENRYIPSGPTTFDELANFAFWVGVMKGRPKQFDDMTTQMDFRDVKSNFIKAARTGKESVQVWKDEAISVRDLVQKELLPIAYEGLRSQNIDSKDIERFLEVIDKRASGHTGAQWKVKNYRKLCNDIKPDKALRALTKTMYEYQSKDIPVHEWKPIADIPETEKKAKKIHHIMSTQLFTVNEHDLSDLATHIMKWKGVHHVPVEDNSGKLCGLLTWTHMKKYLGDKNHDLKSIVKDIMVKEPLTAGPDMPIKDAIRIMKENEYGCLPVVQDAELIGIVTIPDVKPFDHD